MSGFQISKIILTQERLGYIQGGSALIDLHPKPSSIVQMSKSALPQTENKSCSNY